MMQISARIVSARRAIATRIERRKIEFVLRFEEIDVFMLGDADIMAREASWQNAIEHIDPARHGFLQIARSADTH